MNTNVIDSILDIVKSCDDLQLCTFGLGQYPETRHLMNGMNRDIKTLDLHFLTNNNSPKYHQFCANPHCCLYYFNAFTRHAVRLFGKIQIIDDMAAKQKYWRDEYVQYGYTGWDDEYFALLQFVPDEYKFYIGNELHTGQIQ